MENALVIDEFPDYVIDKTGSVYKSSSGRLRRPSRTQNGAYKVTLYRDGVPFTKSLPRLVANAFVYNNYDPEIFDTPIHLDNDLANNYADNLEWRPRWFAVRYQQQYWKPEYRHSRTPVEDVKTGEIYESIMGPCQRYGLLFIDVLNSCLKGKEVFPTWKQFRFLD